MIEGHIAHISQGRIRIKFHQSKGNEELFSFLSDSLKNNETFLNIKTNPTTGSLLLEHEKSTEEIINLLKNLNLFQIKEKEETPKKKITHSINKNIGYFNRIIRKLSSGALDLKGTILLFLIISALYQIGRGNISSIPWYTALFYLNSLISKD